MFSSQLSFNRVNAGFSLLEVLVTFFISLLLVTTLTQLYLQHHRAYIHDNERDDAEHIAVKIHHLLHDEIERAGQIGCAQLNKDFTVNSYQQYSITPENALLVNDDKLEVRYQSLLTAKLKQWFNPQKFSMTAGSGVEPGSIMVISDCVHAEIFAVKYIQVLGDNVVVHTVSQLQHQYTDEAEIGRYISYRYYRKDNCLWRENENHREAVTCHLDKLHFQHDGSGVEYMFQLNRQEWHGYAARA